MAIPTPDPSLPLPQEPAAVYRSRMAELKLREQALQRRHILLGYVRLVFGIAVVVFLLPPRLWALLAFAAFAVAARIHGNVLQRLAGTRRTLAFFEHAIARAEDRWPGLRPRSTRLDTAPSLYAADLDLFGPASLFELLCEARTSLGEDTLAAWLLAPVQLPEVQARQAAVADLRTRLALREGFAAARGPALAVLDRQALAAWAERPGDAPPLWLGWLAPVLVLLTVAGVWESFRLHLLLPLVAALVVNSLLTYRYRRAFTLLFAEAETATKSLRSAAALLAAIEGESFTAPRLQELQNKLQSGFGSAAGALASLANLSAWIEGRGNYLVRILDVPLLYSLQLAIAVRRWKMRYGAYLGSWLEELGRFEALLSLAAYSYEHPGDVFPQLVAGQPQFRAEGLGHPLLPAATCVRNDVTFGDAAQMLLISGSNMSGKSTLLRSIGINAVLAFAGAPVRAHALWLSPLTLAANIQVNDSLQAGRSRFYAEILRLRAITEAARVTHPVLFLIDEVLAGTNSSDRLTGAQGLVSALLRSDAIGLLSTHDLALTAVEGSGPESIRNMHFQDEVVEGQLRFDYKLRDGVVERSNGIALMRLIGLDV